MSAIRGDVVGAVNKPVLAASQYLDQGPGSGVQLGHRVPGEVDYPHVSAVGGDTVGVTEPVLGSFQHLDQGSGGSVQLSHRRAIIVGHPDMGTVDGDGC